MMHTTSNCFEEILILPSAFGVVVFEYFIPKFSPFYYRYKITILSKVLVVTNTMDQCFMCFQLRRLQYLGKPWHELLYDEIFSECSFNSGGLLVILWHLKENAIMYTSMSKLCYNVLRGAKCSASCWCQTPRQNG